jgi:hypothetical protein
MSLIDKCYCDLLRAGFIVLRQASDASDPEWVSVEIEMLHNLPSLIGETNIARHMYYWEQERTAYIEWVSQPGREVPKSRMEVFYAPVWRELESATRLAR